MRTFNDKTSKTWPVTLDPAVCGRIARDFGQSLSAHLLTTLADSTVGALAWAIVENHAQARGISKSEFLTAIAGRPSHECVAGVMEELAEHCADDTAAILRTHAASMREKLAKCDAVDVSRITNAGPEHAKHVARFIAVTHRENGQVSDFDVLAAGHFLIAPPGEPIEIWGDRLGEAGRAQVIEAVRQLVNQQNIESEFPPCPQQA